MENPGEMLKRARQNQGRRAAVPEREKELPRRAAAVLKSGHSGYTALMRSHDRMRTRHIGGKGSGPGA